MKNLYFKAILLCLCLFASINAFAYDAEIDGIYYNFISENEAEVTYQKYIIGDEYPFYSNYSGSISIPQTITYNGKSYSVTSIGNYAFRSCTSLTDVYCHATTPPGATSSSFDTSYIKTNTTLHVPSGSITSYKAADYWKSFKSIVAL